jgi:hypothetical protein
MRYVDYDWDLTPTTMVPDQELDTERLGWKHGDFWQVIQTATGQKFLQKVDPLVQFTLGGTNG